MQIDVSLGLLSFSQAIMLRGGERSSDGPRRVVYLLEVIAREKLNFGRLLLHAHERQIATGKSWSNHKVVAAGFSSKMEY